MYSDINAAMCILSTTDNFIDELFLVCLILLCMYKSGSLICIYDLQFLTGWPWNISVGAEVLFRLEMDLMTIPYHLDISTSPSDKLYS